MKKESYRELGYGRGFRVAGGEEHEPKVGQRTQWVKAGQPQQSGEICLLPLYTKASEPSSRVNRDRGRAPR